MRTQVTPGLGRALCPLPHALTLSFTAALCLACKRGLRPARWRGLSGLSESVATLGF